MQLNRNRILAAALTIGVVAAVSAPVAVAHEGGSKCTGVLEKRGASWEATCTSAFQGFPIGVAGVYNADDPLKPPSGLDSDVHVEIMALLADGTSRPLGVECLSVGTDVSRCMNDYNPLTSDPTGPLSLTAPEPAPAEIVALKCNAHSHAVYPSWAAPSGAFACWSTDEARDDLYADHWFAHNGFPPPTS
jgi:hypothetical protein